ncbi:hypothetical protein [Paenibacillus turpanensis]|uniref:hypothetical protein n=1 Tax=Paenibacillus turpanensis TaxID=2689078 RepID=UPI00140E0E86|nr:hypothetical protein [Paenibacillus turpanensis]
MHNRIEAITYKRAAAEQHYAGAMEAVCTPRTEESLLRCAASFTAMMGALESALQIARECAFQQSSGDVRVFMKSLEPADAEELGYIEQWVEANRADFLFELRREPELHAVIKPLSKRRDRGAYPERELTGYVAKVKEFADRMLDRLLEIYRRENESFDQSWRTMDVNRVTLLCAECGVMVSQILRHLGDLRDVVLKEKESLLPRFAYVYGHELIRANLLPYGGANEITAEEYIVHIGALDRHAVKQPKEASGCCGPDGSRFNVFCINGHAIGREASDCWLPHFIRIPVSAVRRSEV